MVNAMLKNLRADCWAQPERVVCPMDYLEDVTVHASEAVPDSPLAYANLINFFFTWGSSWEDRTERLDDLIALLRGSPKTGPPPM